jgi:hypothetical protein
MYEKGQWFLVHYVDRTPVLVQQVPAGAWAYTFSQTTLREGDLIRSAGMGYSGGSDGIELPIFDRVVRAGVMILANARGQFEPNSWGSPLAGYLEPIGSDAPAGAGDDVEAYRG